VEKELLTLPNPLDIHVQFVCSFYEKGILFIHIRSCGGGKKAKRCRQQIQ
jgi:hypothetical protein